MISKLKIKGKKGDITDTFTLVIWVFIIGIVFFIIAFIVPKITNGLRDSGLNNTSEGEGAIDSLETFGISTIQKGVFFLFIGLCLGVLISAFYIDSHPIWLFLYIIFLGLSLIIGAYLGNAYETLINNASFEGFEQTWITIFMQHSLTIFLGTGAFSFIILFSKFFRGGSGGTPI